MDNPLVSEMYANHMEMAEMFCNPDVTTFFDLKINDCYDFLDLLNNVKTPLSDHTIEGF